MEYFNFTLIASGILFFIFLLIIRRILVNNGLKVDKRMLSINNLLYYKRFIHKQKDGDTTRGYFFIGILTLLLTINFFIWIFVELFSLCSS